MVERSNNPYSPDDVGKKYIPRTEAFIEAGEKSGYKPASEDKVKLLSIGIEAINDFMDDGALPVSGAYADIRRFLSAGYEGYFSKVTQFLLSQDDHVPLQIFYPSWWVDKDGNHPKPFTQIKLDGVLNGIWKPIVNEDWSKYYLEQLESKSKKNLTIWPYHSMSGTHGQNIVSALSEAVTYWGVARKNMPIFLRKGRVPETEYYGIFAPEVIFEQNYDGRRNDWLLDEIGKYDVIDIWGQALTHCVSESIYQINVHRPELINRVRLIMDATSPIVSPQVDFYGMTMEELNKLQEKGLKLITTKDLIK